MEEQLKILRDASLLVTVHRAAMVMAAFLSPRAVAVEMIPIGFITDFYHGMQIGETWRVSPTSSGLRKSRCSIPE